MMRIVASGEVADWAALLSDVARSALILTSPVDVSSLGVARVVSSSWIIKAKH
jgi:hypothetical protein